MDDSLQKRGQALEDVFFHERDQQLLAALKKDLQEKSAADSLAEACGFRDEVSQKELAALGISSESLLAVCMIPLVHVAWADGVIQPAEREAIMRAAADSHLASQPAALKLLESWLVSRPPHSMFDSWRHYIAAMKNSVDSAAFSQTHRAIVMHSEEVAKAAGGFLGMASISETERKALQDLNAAFD